MAHLGQRWSIAAAIGLSFCLAGFGCASMHDSGVFLPPERSVMPEYPARAAQHQVLSVVWRVPLMSADGAPVDHHHYGQPAVSRDGERIYVGSYDGAFYCIQAASGKVLWRKLVAGPFDSQPLVTGGVVYVGSGGGDLYAWRETDGQLLWSYRSGSAIDSEPVLAGDSLLFATDANTVTCLHAMTGEWRWTYRRDVPTGRFQVKGVARPLVTDDVVYAGFSDGTLAKLALADGALLAVRKLAERSDRFTDVDTQPLMVGKDLLLVGPFSRGVVALEPRELHERWNHAAKGISSMVKRGQTVFYTTADSKVEALRVDSGQPVWRFDATKGALSEPVLAGNWLLVSSSEHSLLVIDSSDGHLLQVFNPGKGSGAAPAVAGKRVYWVSNGQTLYCMSLAG